MPIRGWFKEARSFASPGANRRLDLVRTETESLQNAHRTLIIHGARGRLRTARRKVTAGTAEHHDAAPGGRAIVSTASAAACGEVGRSSGTGPRHQPQSPCAGCGHLPRSHLISVEERRGVEMRFRSHAEGSE